LTETLAEIDRLRSELAQQARSQAEEEHLRRELTVEAIYHTNRIEGNQLTLPEVRAIVQAFWAEANGHGEITHDAQPVATSCSKGVTPCPGKF
jgi:Fic family protein